MKEDAEKKGWYSCPVVGVVSHFRLVASFFVVDVRIFPLATRKSTRRASAAVRKLSNERYGGRWRSANSSTLQRRFGFQYASILPRNDFRGPASRSTCSQARTLCLFFYESKQRINSNANINMQSNEPRYAIVNNS